MLRVTTGTCLNKLSNSWDEDLKSGEEHFKWIKDASSWAYKLLLLSKFR